MPDINISDQTNARLQKMAVPLTDTHDSVISRLLDTYENVQTVTQRGAPIAERAEGRKQFDPANPPHLSFTTVTKVTVFDSKPFHKSVTYWNNLLIGVIQAINEHRGKDAAAIYDMIHHANAFIGDRSDNGYKFIQSVGLSIQGQDANSAFRQAYKLAVAANIPFTVEFEWQANEKAAFPNERGYFEVS